PAVGAAGIVGKDGLQGRVSLSGGSPLLARVTRYTYHANLAVGPRLLGDPLDGVVMIGVFVSVVAFGLGRSARLCDDMDVTCGEESPRIARFDRTEPKRSILRLRRQHIGDIGALHVFVVQRRRIQDGESPLGLR